LGSGFKPSWYMTASVTGEDASQRLVRTRILAPRSSPPYPHIDPPLRTRTNPNSTRTHDRHVHRSCHSFRLARRFHAFGSTRSRDLLRSSQREDGRFVLASIRDRFELTGRESFTWTQRRDTDLRLTYCAFVICTLLNDWSGVNVEKALEFVRRCRVSAPVPRFFYPLKS